MTSTNLIPKYAVLQNEQYAQGDLPPGWSAGMVSLSGGRAGWGDAHDGQAVVGMGSYRVGRIIDRHVPRYEPGTLVVFNAEKPVHPGQIVHDDPDQLERYAEAYSMRTRLLRAHLGPGVPVLCWIGARTWQDAPTDQDYLRWASMVHLARLGAFEHVDGFVPRVYPIVGGGEPQWRRGAEVMRNSVRGAEALAMAAQHEHGRQYMVVPHASLETFSTGRDRTLTAGEVIEIEQWASRAGVPAIGYWHADRWLRDGADAVQLMRQVSEMQMANAADQRADLEDDAH